MTLALSDVSANLRNMMSTPFSSSDVPPIADFDDVEMPDGSRIWYTFRLRASQEPVYYLVRAINPNNQEMFVVDTSRLDLLEKMQFFACQMYLGEASRRKQMNALAQQQSTLRQQQHGLMRQQSEIRHQQSEIMQQQFDIIQQQSEIMQQHASQGSFLTLLEDQQARENVVLNRLRTLVDEMRSSREAQNSQQSAVTSNVQRVVAGSLSSTNPNSLPPLQSGSSPRQNNLSHSQSAANPTVSPFSPRQQAPFVQPENEHAGITPVNNGVSDTCLSIGQQTEGSLDQNSFQEQEDQKSIWNEIQDKVSSFFSQIFFYIREKWDYVASLF